MLVLKGILRAPLSQNNSFRPRKFEGTEPIQNYEKLFSMTCHRSPNLLTIHTTLIKGVEVHHLNSGGGSSPPEFRGWDPTKKRYKTRDFGQVALLIKEVRINKKTLKNKGFWTGRPLN